jgi:hypothetical protein
MTFSQDTLLGEFHRGYAAVARVPIAGENIACRVVGSAVAVCNIHAEESDREPGGRSLHRARARVHAADAGEETRRISDEIAHCTSSQIRGLLWVVRVILAARRSFPVYPYKQTFSVCVGMSEKCQWQAPSLKQLSDSY